MEFFLSIFIAGFSGGVVRGLVGFIKHRNKFKSVPFKPVYFLSMTLVSGTVGLLSAWVAKDIGITFLGLPILTPAVAVVIGYAGGDFIENIFKILTGKTSLYDLPKF
jgi:hypothetical protein